VQQPVVPRPAQAVRPQSLQPAQQQLSYQRSQYGPVARLQRCRAEPEQQAAAEHPFPEEEDFDLLSKKVAELTQYLNQELRGCSIYLVGMMGSGKSTVSGCRLLSIATAGLLPRISSLQCMHETMFSRVSVVSLGMMPSHLLALLCGWQVGRMLANTLKYAFFDTDTMVEMAHEKKPVGHCCKVLLQHLSFSTTSGDGCICSNKIHRFQRSSRSMGKNTSVTVRLRC
jgi:hypothetical protein